MWSAGGWEGGGSYGRYRVIVRNLGWEHTRSFLYLQWLKIHDDTRVVTKLKTIAITEFNERDWFNVHSIDYNDDIFVIRYTVRGKEGVRKAVLNPAAPGKYVIQLQYE